MAKKNTTPPAEAAEAKTVNPEALETPQASPEESPKPEGRRAVVRSPKGLNLRVGPALNYDALEVLADGAEVTALNLPEGVTVPGWELVHTGERAGWVSARFLRPLEA